MSGLVEREKQSFESLYPDARLEVRAGTSREAIRSLFAAESDVAVITRELAPEERAAAVKGRLELEGFRFARDAAVVIVNSTNPVENMTLEDLRGIYEGELADWSAMGGPRRDVEPVVQSPAADLTAFFVAEALKGEPVRAKSFTEDDDAAVVKRVSQSPGAIGYVSMSAPLEGVRALRIATMAGLPYWKPDAESVYKGDYPLTRPLSFYVRTGGPRVQNGFITYVTSQDGQRLVHDSGFVPTSIPVRFVRRSPMLGTH